MLFYLAFGASVVLIPALADRVLKGRVRESWRRGLYFLVAALTGVLFSLIARL
jgi:hypothetical protein